jgi:hypothetical protein
MTDDDSRVWKYVYTLALAVRFGRGWRVSGTFLAYSYALVSRRSEQGSE